MNGRIGCAWLILALVVLANSPLASAEGAADRSPATLAGAEAWAGVLGNTLTGSTADGPYSDYFAPDGTAVHVDGAGRETGSWTRNGDTICFRYPTDPDEHVECRRLEVRGLTGAFIDPDGARYPFAIRIGNPDHL